MTPEDTLSYDGVEAQTSNFFRTLTNNRVIEPEAQARMAGKFFADVSQIRAVRDRNAMVPLQLERERLALDSARFSLERARKQADQEDSFSTLNTDVDDTLAGIMADDMLTPEEKVQEMRRAEFEALRRVPPSMSGGASWLSRKFGAATKSVLPSAGSDLTPAQTISLFQSGVPRETIERGDPLEIGQAVADIARRAEIRKAEAEQMDEQAKANRSAAAKYESDLLSITGIDFATDPNNLDAQGNPVIDKTRLKGGDVALAKLKRVLSKSANPEIRKAAATDDLVKLREAYMMEVTSPSTGAPKKILPPRP